MRRLATRSILACSFGLVPSLAFAGGVEVPDMGTVALGRGSAFTAKADNLSAFHYNPAGLSKSPGINVLLGANLTNMNVQFDRGGSGEFICYASIDENCVPGDQDSAEGFAIWDPAVDPNTGDPYATVRQTHAISPAPMFVLQYGDVGGVDGLAIAAGVMSPSAFGFPTYDAGGAQRYALHGAEALIVLPGIGLSYRVNRYFSIGATFLAGITHAQFSQSARGTINPMSTNRNENPDGDATFSIDVRDWFSPVGQIGILSNPIDELELGASVRTPVTIDARGELGYAPSEEEVGSTLEAGGVNFRQQLPWVVRAGARYIHDRFDVEVDYVYEAWGQTKTYGDNDERGFHIDFDDDVFVNLSSGSSVQVLDVVLLKRWRDSHSVRLGSDIWALKDVLAVRVGGWWQSSPLPANHETLSVDFPNAMQYAVGGGLTWHAAPKKKPKPHKIDNWIDVNVGYQHVFQPEIEVTKGVIQQQGIRTPDIPPTGNILNNGVYRVNYNVASVSIETHF